MPVDAAMELGTGYEWCDADAITEKQQTGQLAGPENGGWDFSVFGTREQPNPPWDWKERTFYELVRCEMTYDVLVKRKHVSDVSLRRSRLEERVV